jgi:hypothetical protein
MTRRSAIDFLLPTNLFALSQGIDAAVVLEAAAAATVAMADAADAVLVEALDAWPHGTAAALAVAFPADAPVLP